MLARRRKHTNTLSTSRSPNWMPHYTTWGTSAQEEKEVFLKMDKIEKMKKYIERTKLKENDGFALGMQEALELTMRARDSKDFPLEIIDLAFKYGKAKGYRAAKAEVRA